MYELVSMINNVYESSTDRYCIYKRNDTYFICFRGSKDITDWVHSLLMFSYRKNHFGYSSIYRECIDDIISCIDKSNSIIVTGHSMGGAVATMVHNHLVNNGYDSRCYTFGSPMYTMDTKYVHKLFNIKEPNDVSNYIFPWFTGRYIDSYSLISYLG